MSASYRSYSCGKCNLRNLRVTHRMELGSNERSEIRILQIIECSACGFKGIAFYEELKRGKYDSESWNHIGYEVSREVLSNVVKAIDSYNTKINLSGLKNNATFSFAIQEIN